MSRAAIFSAVIAILGCAASPAAAQSFISSSGDAALAGATTETFGSVAQGSYANLPLGGVTLTGNDTLYVESTYAGDYNSTGNYLANRLDGFNSLTFSFVSPVTAFGFNWGASNESWILSAYDASDALIASYSVPESQYSNAGDFYGIAASGIARGVLTQTSFNFDPVDYVLIDNLRYVAGDLGAVPEPESWALMLLGFGVVGGAMRSAKRRQALRVSYT
jgi:hypothetical protein